MRKVSIILPFVAACSGSAELEDSAAEQTDLSTETDVDPEPSDSGTDSADTDLPIEPAELANYHHVVAEITVAPTGTGFDLDGDGDLDNALLPFKSVLDPLIVELYDGATTSTEGVLQVWGVATLVGASSGALSVITANDTDGDPSDNTSGTEPLVANGNVDEQGRGIVGVTVELADGEYETSMLEPSITLGTYTLETATLIHLAGTIAVDRHDVLVGFALSEEALLAVAEALGLDDSFVELLLAAVNVDSDGDGTDDALGMAFEIGAVSCVIGE